MRVLQTISFLALMLGAGGIENQNGELQPAAIGIMFAALLVLLVVSSHKNAPACGDRTRSNRKYTCAL